MDAPRDTERRTAAGSAPLARWTVARGADGRHHRLTVETTDGCRLRGMLTTPSRRIVLLNDFACRHLQTLIIDVSPLLARFHALEQDGTDDAATHAQWSSVRTYGPLRWSLKLDWDGAGPPTLVFRRQSAAPITLSLEDAAFLLVALPAAVQGCRQELEIDALQADEAAPIEPVLSTGNTGKRWSDAEEETVWRLWDEGRAIEDIAHAVQRAPSAIAGRFSRFNPTDR